MVKESDYKVKSLDQHTTRPGPMMGARLRNLLREIDDAVNRALAEAGFDDIRVAHHVVFQYMHPEGSRVTELAEQARMTKQAVQYLVDHLESGGYLERVPDPEDRRAKRVRLTMRGQQVEHKAREAIAALEKAWATKVGHKEFAQFLSLLHTLHHPTD